MYVSAAILLAFLAYLLGYQHGHAVASRPMKPNLSGGGEAKPPAVSTPSDGFGEDEPTVVEVLDLPQSAAAPGPRVPPGRADLERAHTRRRLRYAP